MEPPAGFRQRTHKRKVREGQGGGGGSRRPQLFQDTSNTQTPQQQAYGMSYGQQQYGGYPPQNMFPGQQFFQDPRTSMAMQFGTTLADQGKDYVNRNLEKYMATSKLKYYFAVDTVYVGKKIGLLIFPYSHANWSIQYNQNDPIPPRYDVNAPDLYIPVMAFVTYLLVAGVVMGTQNRFTPEQIWWLANRAMGWVIMELLATLFSLYIMNLNTELKFTDCLAYSGYKFVGMIFSLIGGLLFKAAGYYLTLLWFGASISFFLVRTLRQKIFPHAGSDGNVHGTKRCLYLIILMALAQPVLMWSLTSHIIFERRI